MAPRLFKRDILRCDSNGENCTVIGDRWYDYGRWVAASGLILGFLLVLMLCVCMSARRRRKVGGQPLYGTAWMAPKPPNYSANPQYQNQAPPQNDYGGYYNAPAPPYSPNPAFEHQTTGTANTNDRPYYPPPPGPPPTQSYEMHNVMAPPATYPPVHAQQTGSSMQSNNPYYQPPEGPPPPHMSGAAKQ